MLTAVRFVSISIALSYCVSVGREFITATPEKRATILLGLMLIPLGLSLFMLHLYVMSGDALAFMHIQRAWNRIPTNPFTHIWNGLHESGFVLLAALENSLGLFLIGLLFIQRRYELAWFALLATLIPLSTGLFAMPRYLWWQAPLLLVITEILMFKKVWLLILPSSFFALAYMYASWRGGAVFVI